MMVEETIGERIKKLREAKGWSQEDLAQACNMTGSYIGSLERGYERYTNPTIASITAIADALKVHPSVILYEKTELAPNVTFLSGTYVDVSNPLEVADFMKENEPLFPLSKEERELLSSFRKIQNLKKRHIVRDLLKNLQDE